MSKVLLALSAAAVVAACAAPEQNASNEVVEKYTRTGTNIPERERMGVQTVSVEEFERQRAANSGTLVRDPMKTGR